MPQVKLVLTGSLAVDQIMNFDGSFEEMIKPEALRVLSISILLKELRKTRGGIAANIAYSLALLGEKPVLFAAIGDDQKTYMNDLQQMGVDISNVHFSTLPTASFSVITDKNDCQVGGFYPGAMSDASSLSFKKMNLTNALAVISSHDPVQMAVQIHECNELKQRMVFDVGQQVIMLPTEVLLEGLQIAELLILNDYEMSMLSDRLKLSEEEIIKMVKTCVITLGEAGSKLYTKANKRQPEKIPAIKINKVVDPTGAGDGFRAGFLYGYVRNWDSARSARLGSTVASFVLEHRGTQEHRFDRVELEQRLQHAYQVKETL